MPLCCVITAIIFLGLPMQISPPTSSRQFIAQDRLNPGFTHSYVASIAIQGPNQPYNLSDIALYKGYADVSTFSVVSKDSVGMELSATDDLDNCFEGVYYCNNADTATHVGHTPLGDSVDVTSGFRMESIRLSRNNRFMQTLTYIGQPEKVYVRQYTAISGTEQWGSWYRYEGQIVT